jgi:hypothetical protein
VIQFGSPMLRKSWVVRGWSFELEKIGQLCSFSPLFHFAFASSFSEIVPIFLYSDVVYFPSLTWAEFRRLEIAFNACTSYEICIRSLAL